MSTETITNTTNDTIDTLISEYSDVYKEAHGVRPHGCAESLRLLSVAELEAEINKMSIIAASEHDRELNECREIATELKAKWSRLANESNVSLGTVVRWMTEEEDDSYGLDSFIFSCFGTFNQVTHEFKAWLKTEMAL